LFGHVVASVIFLCSFGHVVAFLCYFRDAVIFLCSFGHVVAFLCYFRDAVNFFMLMWTCYRFLQMSSDDSSDESDDFFKIVLSGAMLA